MTKIERIKAAISGEKVDMYPFSFWTHLPHCDLNPVQLAEETYSFFKTYDIDLIKTMNNGMYSCEDFGCVVDYSEVAKGGVAKMVDTPVKSIEDWDNIPKLKLENAKALQRELYSLKLLLEKTKNDNVPVIFTCFSPMTTAQKLCKNKLLNHIASGKTDGIHRALQNITDVSVELVKAAIDMGAAGVYFATQLSNTNVCSEEIYKEFGAKYDIRVLEASTGYADTLHCHGNNIMFEVLKDYPVDIFNWHVYESKPSLEEAKAAMDKCIMTGILREDVTASNLEMIDKYIEKGADIFKGTKHIFSPGCVVRYPLNEETLKYISDKVRNIKL